MALSARLLSCMPVASYMPSSFVRSPAQLRLRLRALSFCYLGSSKSLRLSHHHRHRQVRAMSNRPINGEASDSDAADSTPRIVLDVSSSSSIVPVELHKEATDSYLSYALSVLFGRALPDVRDGLKPVHRRIIFAMHELGLSSKRPYKKCARVVGEVLGKFHPHGDSAVYASLVRMAQDFSLRSPLVSGHGNFGSLDADPPAAMRYTECRLQALSEAMLLADLEQNTVDFISNFDGSQQEPALLPARLPNILLNGASGIAVGMATSIPPHNLGEVADALIAFINNPDATVQELMEYIRGPDFPTGGKILGIEGILEAYRTGRGSVLVRGTTEVELLDNRSNKSAIIIREIPYQTNKAAFVSRIAELIDNKVIDGISDVRDESDRSGMRVVLELKRGGDPSIVLNNIYKHTSLQTAFNCNIVGIINGQPKVMSLTDILKSFVEFRVSVVSRRATFQLKTAEEREHIVKGILTGLDNIDDVVNIIRKSGSHQDALIRLKEEFTLSEKQGSALLEMSLKRLTMLERNRYAEEQKVLHGKIENLRELLADRKKILQVIVKEAVELKEKFNTPRRSVIEENEKAELDDLDMIPNEEMLLALSEKGYIKRMKPDHFSAQHRGTVGKSLGKLREHDAMSEFIICRAHDHILYFSDKGIVYSARAFRVPECSRTASGTPLVQVLALSSGERVTSIIPVSEFSENQYLIMLTAKAYIKRVSLGLFSSMRSTGIIAIQLVPGDQLRWVRQCSDKDLIAVGSRMGYLLLSSCGKVRALSRTSRGVRSMRLKGEDTVASMDIVPSTVQQELQKDLLSLSSLENSVRTPWLLFVTENGYGKRVPLNQFKVLPLNRVGLVAYKLMPDDGVAGLFVAGLSRSEDGESDEQVVLVSQSGTLNRIKVRDISIQSRYARGVILMRLEYGGKIQSVSLISSSEAEKETAEI